jgi:hypothetical protein
MNGFLSVLAQIRVERGCGSGMCVGVNRWKAILSVLCLATWLPATQHCQLENLPGLAFLHCSTDTPGKSDCQGDSCDVVERGMYKAPDSGDQIIVPIFAAMLIAAAPAIENEAPKLCREIALVAAPLRKRAESWQCYSPVALPIRGPSVLS